MRVILFIICLLFSSLIYSQQKEIHAGASLGIKGCSINGQGVFKSFNFVGITGGLFAYIDLDRDYSLQFELNYIQKGSRPNYEYFETRGYINLNYAEIPVLLKIKTENNGPLLEIGVSYARLISSEYYWIIPPKIPSPFKRSDISFLLGYEKELYLTKRDIPFFLNFRYSFSVTRITPYSYNLPPSNSMFNFSKTGQYNRVFHVTLRYVFGG